MGNLIKRIIMKKISKEIKEHKICSKCGENKHLSEYYLDNRKWRKPNSVRSTCKKCDIIINKEYAKKHPEYTAYRLRYTRLHHYGITIAQYNYLLKKQNNCCAACGKPHLDEKQKRLHVDHDHACCSGKTCCGKCIRGLLCFRCNTALGLLNDNPESLKNLINYLEEVKYEVF